MLAKIVVAGTELEVVELKPKEEPGLVAVVAAKVDERVLVVDAKVIV
jgi:hypothetical protein